ncbi:phage/plasmid primase, P4 family [Cytophagaceae bacterium YF14B1]|uniref:Phage/plasmid primase, P4 family n=1 Tax=Xanthocytophaga flava TaxID=3048013 RepID=A0AAE3QRD1_9BACT|nr:phage/plasmid primase, P4 family [Xanthocytophaga flavus]MDJ1481751.1 phage/plasmid primase, P4 family [Xanthocytophaga flavus]
MSDLTTISEHIRSHMNGLHAKPELIPHNQITNKLLEKIEKKDLRETVGLPEDEKLKKNHILVVVIEELLRLAKQNSWGLCRVHDFVYVYNSAFWSLLDKDELQDFLGRAAEKMGVDKFDARVYTFREQLYKQFLSAAHLSKPDSNKDITLINLKNGTLHIGSNGGELKAFSSKDFITYQLPFEFDEFATCPVFEAYLKRVLPDPTLRDILAEFLGYLFVRNLKLEKCLLLYGGGANGKSVFFEIVNALLGNENVSNFSLSNLQEEHNRALIANKRLNYGSEIKAGIESDIFKQLVSGEPVQARMKYGNSFTMTDYARLCFNCNELPKDVEHTEAYFRRFLIIPFEVTIPEEERNPQLAQIIIEKELAGVFNWVLSGLKRLIRQKNFTYSDAAREAVSKYRLESDSVSLFLREEDYKKSAVNFTHLKTMYQDYRHFCSTNGQKALSNINFSKRLQSTGYQLDRKNSGMVVYAEKPISV